MYKFLTFSLPFHEYEGPTVTPPELLSELGNNICPSLPISYRGNCARDSLINKCSFMRRWIPDLNYRAAFLDKPRREGPPRVGVISNQMTRRCSVQITSGSVLCDYKILSTGDNIFNYANFKKLSGNDFYENRDLIEDEEFDVIIYPDIHLDIRTDLFAMCRLGRVQATTWGHSDTSGMDSLDYYVTSSIFEIPDCQKYYSECILKSNSLTTFYPNFMETISIKPRVVPEKYMFFAGTKYKVNENIIEKIKKIWTNTRLCLVFIQYNENLKMFEENLQIFGVKMLKFNTQKLEDFISLLHHSEIVLDTYPFGNCNIAFQSMMSGACMPTQPSDRLYGRFAQGLYRVCDLPELIAVSDDDYVSKCIEFIRNPKNIKEKILKSNHKIFQDFKSKEAWGLITSQIFTKITPNLHFIYGLKESEEMCWVHYNSIRSAIHHNSPQTTFFWYHWEPWGKWWDLIKPQLTLRQVALSDDPRFSHYAHYSDYLRLMILYELGGIYMDIDTISNGPLDVSPGGVTLGSQEGPRGLCNAIIGAVPRSLFIKRWLDTYENFRGGSPGTPEWDFHSVKVPALLYKQYPTNVTVRSNWHSIHWSDCERVMFSSTSLVPEHPIYHLCETMYYDRLKQIDPTNIREGLYKKIVNKTMAHIDKYNLVWDAVSGEFIGMNMGSNQCIDQYGTVTHFSLDPGVPSIDYSRLPSVNLDDSIHECRWEDLSPRGDEVITWCIAAWNRGTMISDAINSLKAQTDPEFNCIIVDDGSDDATFEVALDLVRGDRRFTVFTQDNVGYPRTCRLMHDRAPTSVVALLDSDDILEPRANEILKTRYRREKCAGITTQWYKCNSSLKFCGMGFAHESDCLETDAYEHIRSWRKCALSPHTFKTLAEDRDFFYRIQETGTLLFEPTPLIKHRFHSDSLMSSKFMALRASHCESKIKALRRRLY